MRKWFMVAAVLLQGAILVYMAGEREYLVRTGRTVYLRTAPIDPQDPFRGDYVRLDYQASTIPQHLLRDGLAQEDGVRKKGRRIYAVLKMTKNNLVEVVYVTDRKPQDELFIRGHLERVWERGIGVRYGIGAYFVQQDRGLELERGRDRRGIQIPLEMEVALGGNGLAVLKNHRWCRLGIGIELDLDKQERTQAVKIKLLNASKEPLAIVDLPGGRSFSLEPDWTDWRWRSGDDWRWVRADLPPPAIEDADVHILQPGEIYPVHIDLSQAYWFVTKGNEPPRPLADPDWGPRFRLVYRPPSEEECRHLRQADLIWHGYLSSPAFSGRGRVD